MSTIGCNEFRKQFEAWMEGDRTPDARAHVRECPHCRSLVEDMDAVRLVAHAWSVEEADPPARVWLSLRAQLEREGLIRDEVSEEAHASAPSRTEAPRGWLAGIFAAVPRPGRWISGTQDSTGTLSAQLQTAERDSVSAMAGSDPVVTASLHDNLAIVDNYIALCEKSVREDPESEIARDYLYDAYEQKADLLAQMTERGVNGR